MGGRSHNMLTSQQCEQRFGPPNVAFERKYMTIWSPPPQLVTFPRRVYCHRLLMPLLNQAADYIIERGLTEQVRTWDGCFNVRLKKGGKTFSLHAWGLAIDICAAWNQFGDEPTMSPELVACFTDAGWEWGGTWSKPDGMHMQCSEKILT